MPAYTSYTQMSRRVGHRVPDSARRAGSLRRSGDFGEPATATRYQGAIRSGFRDWGWVIDDSIGTPDPPFVDAELGEVAGAERRFLRREELVELRRRNASTRQHCMRLAAVVDLVLEEV